MRLCRYNEDKWGLVKGDQLIDVTIALEELPDLRWPRPPGDQMIANLESLKAGIEANRKMGYVQGVNNVKLLSPVANPTKIIGAPVNYRDHLEEAAADAEINLGREIKTIAEYGLFLKANSALVGAGEGIELGHTDRRNDHEIELAIVIGREAKNVAAAAALDYVAGYSIGLDVTVRGVEDRSLRKSLDSYALLGPWMTTADEIDDPDDLDFEIRVNGEIRQKSNTKYLIYDCRRLIEYASSFYTLYPGDIIMTGTPQGVGPLEPGDKIQCEMEIVGRMDVDVR